MNTYKATYGIMKTPSLYCIPSIHGGVVYYEVKNIFVDGTEEDHKMLLDQLKADGYSFVPVGTYNLGA